ncbi:TBC1 domain family member 20 [Plakobranchus ocellatus]|uniref:TBC1 domain family member 20 n=1 Tax=Plakobranchus ocellatus TaxID=259542 RepID=A0AAV4A3C7_9GAST|nr:TBC1 domain family member 20 [Plakobranchus ocellatus]
MAGKKDSRLEDNTVLDSAFQRRDNESYKMNDSELPSISKKSSESIQGAISSQETDCDVLNNSVYGSDMDDLSRQSLPPMDKRGIVAEKDIFHQSISDHIHEQTLPLTDIVSMTEPDKALVDESCKNKCDEKSYQLINPTQSEFLEPFHTYDKNLVIVGSTVGDSEVVQSCPSCKDISLDDFELDDLSDSLDSAPCLCEAQEMLDNQAEEGSPNFEHENFTSNTIPSPDRSPSPVLRHRLEPEPPRSEGTDKVVGQEETEPKSSKAIRKLADIQKALDADPVDVETLRKLAISPGGLINTQMRQQVWPLLINANTSNIPPKPEKEEMEAMTKTYNQVVMDVNRSSSRFPPGIDDHVRMSMKDKLVDLIMRVMLHHNGQLKYYQGFHDVCVTFLLCMDEDKSFAMVNKLSIGYMREYLDETMERTSLLLNYIYPLINKCNPELCDHMQRNDLGTIFALSWVITWFSHVLGDIKRILRVFDFFLASHRMMPVYLSAAFVLHRENDIFDAGDEMGYIHKCLSVIPSDLPLESLLERAGDLYLQYPPTEISQDPMLIRLNNEVYEHFNRIESRNARRLAQQQEASNLRNRLFVRVTLWTVTAVVGVAVAVLYHTYTTQEWAKMDPWNS